MDSRLQLAFIAYFTNVLAFQKLIRSVPTAVSKSTVSRRLVHAKQYYDVDRNNLYARP